MKLRSAVWAGIVGLCFAASSCTTRSTPANTQSNQAQPTPETAPQPSPAPTAAEDQSAAKPKTTAKARATKPPKPVEPDLAQKTAPVPAPTPPPPVVLPAGTVLTVRVNEAMGSKTSKAGDKFTASVAEPVVVHGQTVIPARSAVDGVVEQAQQGGKIKGSSALSLKLVSLTVRGASYPISTGSFLQEGKGKGSRTAKLGAGGAAAGALIGGLSGGGKGAAIGSAVGAGAGVAGSAFTGNKELTIPAETVLQFKLAQPLRLAPGAHGNAPSENPGTPPPENPGTPPSGSTDTPPSTNPSKPPSEPIRP